MRGLVHQVNLETVPSKSQVLTGVPSSLRKSIWTEEKVTRLTQLKPLTIQPSAATSFDYKKKDSSYWAGRAGFCDSSVWHCKLIVC